MGEFAAKSVSPPAEAPTSGENLSETQAQPLANFVPVSKGKQATAGPARSVGNLPYALRAGVEALSGQDMGDVHVHRDSAEPAKFGALAITEGTHIYLGPGEDRHLAHEAWHVVQQKQGVFSRGCRRRSDALH